MDASNLYKKTEQYVTDLFNDNNRPDLVFHDLDHTHSVVDRTKEIAGHYYLSEEDMLAVYIAAWFHDTGYLFTDAAHHEEKSVELMQAFMADHSPNEELLDKIAACIMATRQPHQHENLPEQIICDADSYHLGTKEFNKSNKKVWEEFNLKGTVVDEKEWARKTLELLEGHQYYTKYCQDLLEEKKQKNMKKIRKKAQETSEEANIASLHGMQKDKPGPISKDIQTVLRMTSGNHLRLSYMADRKANILISVNAIIISVMLSVMLRKLEEVPYLTIPTILFLTIAVITIVISIIATRPQVSGGVFTKQDILDKKINLLFFGNFHKVSFEEYNDGMRDMMRDTNYLYDSLLRDIYSMGTVLGRKYRLLRMAYNIFMIGIVVSVIAFGVAVFFFHGASTTGTITPASGSPF